MKKFLITLVAVSIAFASSANAGVYFGGRGGFEKYKVENSGLGLDYGKTEYLIGGDIGYHTGFFRLEAEYLYHPRRTFDDRYKTETQTVMGNLFFSPPIKGWLRPYLMGGAGVGFHSFTLPDDSTHKDHNFAWQAGLGLEVKFASKASSEDGGVFLDLGGRMIDMGDPEYDNVKIKSTGYFYYLGLRFEY